MKESAQYTDVKGTKLTTAQWKAFKNPKVGFFFCGRLPRLNENNLYEAFVKHHNHHMPPPSNYVGKACAKCNMNALCIQRDLPILTTSKLDGDEKAFAIELAKLAQDCVVDVIPGKDCLTAITGTRKASLLFPSDAEHTRVLKAHLKISGKQTKEQRDEYRRAKDAIRSMSDGKTPIQAVNDYINSKKQPMQRPLKFRFHTLWSVKGDTAQEIAEAHVHWRDRMLNHFGLDPTWSWTEGLFAINVMTSLSKSRIAYYHSGQQDLFDMVQAPLGGVCSGGRLRKVTANNEYVGYDSSRPTSWIIHVDQNSCFANAYVKHKMPLSGSINATLDWSIYAAMHWDDDTGYILDITFGPMSNAFYPPRARASHDFFKDKIPPFILKIDGLQKPSLAGGRITCSLRRAQMYVKHGYPVIEIHQAQGFKQAKPWAQAGQLIADIRTATNASCGKKCGCESCQVEAMCKMILTHAPGKQSVKKSEYTNSCMVGPTLEDEKRALLDADNFNAAGEDIIAGPWGTTMVQKTRSNKKDTTPHAFGFMVREHAFCNLVDQLYDVLVPRWPNLKFLYTDTDSLVLYIETEENIYAALRDLSKEHNIFDFSAFPKDFMADGEPMFDNNNRKRLGFLSVDPKPIKSADIQRSKVWALEYADGTG